MPWTRTNHVMDGSVPQLNTVAQDGYVWLLMVVSISRDGSAIISNYIYNYWFVFSVLFMIHFKFSTNILYIKACVMWVEVTSKVWGIVFIIYFKQFIWKFVCKDSL